MKGEGVCIAEVNTGFFNPVYSSFLLWHLLMNMKYGNAHKNAEASGDGLGLGWKKKASPCLYTREDEGWHLPVWLP